MSVNIRCVFIVSMCCCLPEESHFSRHSGDDTQHSSLFAKTDVYIQLIVLVYGFASDV